MGGAGGGGGGGEGPVGKEGSVSVGLGAKEEERGGVGGGEREWGRERKGEKEEEVIRVKLHRESFTREGSGMKCCFKTTESNATGLLLLLSLSIIIIIIIIIGSFF